MSERFGILFSLAILISCSSVSLKQSLPPHDAKTVYHPKVQAREIASLENTIEEIRKTSSGSNANWWGDYSRALVNKDHEPEQSCSLFRALSSDENFPLRNEALLRAAETCATDARLIAAVETAFENHQEPWMKELAVDAGIQQARRDKDSKRLARFLFEKAPFLDRSVDRVKLLQEALVAARKSRSKDLARKINARLYQFAPRFTPNPPVSRWPAIADDFRRSRDFVNARKYYNKTLKMKGATPAARIDAYKGLRQTYKLEDDKANYLGTIRNLAAYLSKLYQRDPKGWAKEYHDNGVQLARALWTEGMVKETHSTLDSLEKNLSGRFPNSEIAWLRSRMLEEKGDFSGVVRNSSEALATTEPTNPLYETLLWQVAWNARKVGDLKTSLDYFEKLRKLETSSSPRYRFWYGKLLKENQNPGAATAEFESLFHDEPLSYYSVVAWRELGRNFSPLKGNNTGAGRPSFLTEEQFVRLKWYIATGEKEIGKEYLSSFGRKINGTASADDRNGLYRLMTDLGDYSGLFEKVLLLDPKIRMELMASQPDFVFPSPYAEMAQLSADKFQVPMELIFSIMRQESSFNTFARSPADAFGLMQIIPKSAEEIAKSKNLPYNQPEDLYNPEVNLPLGTALLKRNLDRFEQQFVLTVASYNASEGAVRGWVRTRFRDDPLEFIEDIPYAETMGYVKLVLRNFVFYQRLNSKGAEVPFPEDCLKGLQAFKK